MSPPVSSTPSAGIGVALGSTGAELLVEAGVPDRLCIDTNEEIVNRHGGHHLETRDTLDVVRELEIRRDLVPFVHRGRTHHRVASGARAPHEVVAATLFDWAGVRERIKQLVDAVERTTGPHHPDRLTIPVAIAAYLGRATGNALLLPVLAMVQDIRSELQDEAKVTLERYVFLIRPSAPSRGLEHQDHTQRATAAIVNCDIAATHGVDFPADHSLTAPLAEHVFVYGLPRGRPDTVERQLSQAAADIRLILDPGLLGSAVRSELARRHDPMSPSHVFESLGYSSLVLDRENVVALVRDLAIASIGAAAVL